VRRLRILLPAVLLVGVLLSSVPGQAVGPPPHVPDVAQAHTHGPDGLWLDPRGHRRDAPADQPYDADTHASWNAADWDGRSFTADQPDLSSLPSFHAIYVYPRDGINRFNSFAAMIQADAVQASDRLNALFGRGIRYDYRAGNCYQTPGTPCLDITVFRTKARSNQLSGGNAWGTIYKELSGLFRAPNKKYFVFLDTRNTFACGQGNLAQDTQRSSSNANEGRTQSIIYRPYDPNNGEGGFCRGRTLGHELGHNMGALQKVAPHAFDGAHCDDSAEDVMCYTSATSYDHGDLAFDFGNDDYWDPIADRTGNNLLPGAPVPEAQKLPWWTVNLSRYICPIEGCSSPSTPEF
jgi:hypothetical protein